MILKNYEYLKKHMLPLHNLLKQNPYNMENAMIKNDDKGMYVVRDKKAVYLHSTVDSSKEAALVIDQIEDLYSNDEVVIFGVGNGQILKKITEAVNESCKIYVIDYMNTIQLLLNYYDLEGINFDRIETVTLMNKDSIYGTFFKQFSENTKGNFDIIILPQYKRLFSSVIDEFYHDLTKVVEHKRRSTVANNAFEKRWILNAVRNFPKVMKTSNFMNLSNYDLSESTAIMIASGPSLNYDLDILRDISQKNNVYMFGVGSANKTLLKNSINPDGIITYDPKFRNQFVIKEYLESDVMTPIIFGSTVGNETLEPFDDRFMYHILINQDTVSNILINQEYNTTVINDSPTVALITLQTLIKLGFKEIILCGQNLGFHKKKKFADGIDYAHIPTAVSDKEMENSIEIKDVYGETMYTNDMYFTMKKQLEMLINSNPNVKITNTTKHGASIEGTNFEALENILDRLELSKKPFDLKSDKLINEYEIDEIQKNYNSLDSERYKCREEFKVIDQVLNEIGFALKNGNMTKLDGLDITLEKSINRLSKNKYYVSILRPMNRTYYSILLSELKKINIEKDVEKKYLMIFSKIGGYFAKVFNDYNFMNKEFENINSIF
ncbi:motility associated factor glycosyltransferase family protein [Acidaminobacter sp. JC074]|uniref:motility associated factor glycosyltransferase family protein n=1 Tax=Acidaminobacter sp. JC074 TaxID=2530199 RepID=UPI001F0E64F0|nr:6-hydroxymethylpterin diphosphokinase MptE-like protein [Acidaminobacter sp. JC074]MCH4889294.1 motility associated factor glycosyltransferase family protein [Acidaminobacter sp. JC074]